MRLRTSVPVFAMLAAAPFRADAQGLNIEHKAIGCIVAGKYPKLNACFRPAGDVAKARVYFRPEGVSSWYYVEMASSTPCHEGILPKPKKELIGKHIDYYVEAQDRQFSPGRTSEYKPLVVADEGECDKDTPAAPWTNRAAVTVFPAMPAGFAAGASATPLLLVAGAGAAAAGVAVGVSDGDGPSVAPTTTAPPVPVTQPPTPSPSPSPTVNSPPRLVLVVNPDPPDGPSPLNVNFNLCRSSDPDGDPLQFNFDFGDGTDFHGFCRRDHTYTLASLASKARAAANRTFNVRLDVTDGLPGHTQTAFVQVVVRDENPCRGDSTGPTLTILNPDEQERFVDADFFNASADASDPSGVKQVEFVMTEDESCEGGPFREVDREVDTSGSPFVSRMDFVFGPYDCFMCLRLLATATDNCGNTRSRRVDRFFADNCNRYIDSAPQAALIWTSELAVAGGRAQVVVNDAMASMPGAGRAHGMARLREGDNRIEGTLVEAAGAGTWRFDLSGSQSVAPGSLRVVAGDVVQVSATSVTFRVKGTPGERVVFTFRKR